MKHLIGAREPIYEYTIPRSETEIPDDAFNGCVSLKKLIIHPEITSIGKRAFDGLDFKYAYRLKSGELVFSQEKPKTREKYTDIVEIDKISNAFSGFDCSKLVQEDRLSKINDFAKSLNKSKFSIPHIYRLRIGEKWKRKRIL